MTHVLKGWLGLQCTKGENKETRKQPLPSSDVRWCGLDHGVKTAEVERCGQSLHLSWTGDHGVCLGIAHGVWRVEGDLRPLMKGRWRNCGGNRFGSSEALSYGHRVHLPGRDRLLESECQGQCYARC